MFSRLHLRSVGRFPLWGAVVGSLAIALALPSTSAAQTQVYTTGQFAAECVWGPGLLNIVLTNVPIELEATGPTSLTVGQHFEFETAKATITTPVEMTEALAALGASEVRELSPISSSTAPMQPRPPTTSSARGYPFRSPSRKGRTSPSTYPPPALSTGVRLTCSKSLGWHCHRSKRPSTPRPPSRTLEAAHSPRRVMGSS